MVGSMSNLSVSRTGSVTSNDVTLGISPGTPTSVKSFPAISPIAHTPSKIVPAPGAVQVFPVSDKSSSNFSSAPVPAPRSISIKGDVNKLSARRQKNMDPHNRFSTAFLDQDFSNFQKDSLNLKSMDKECISEESDDPELTMSKFPERITHVHRPTPTKEWSYLTPPIAPTPTPSLYSSSESILQPEIATSPSQSNTNDALASSEGTPALDTKPLVGSNASPNKVPKLPTRKMSRLHANAFGVHWRIRNGFHLRFFSAYFFPSSFRWNVNFLFFSF